MREVLCGKGGPREEPTFREGRRRRRSESHEADDVIRKSLRSVPVEGEALLDRGRPPEVAVVRSLTAGMGDIETLRQRFAMVSWWSEQGINKEVAVARGTYKWKARKINPVDIALPDGISPVGGAFERKEETHDATRCGGKTVTCGSRLTDERLAKMKIGGDFLTAGERQTFVDILYEFEGAVAFDDSEMGCLSEHIEPPIFAHTVPHVPWQQQNLRLPRAAQEEATRIVKQNLASGVLEFSQGPYRSHYFVVPKTAPGTYRLINDMQPMDKVTIRDAGMPPTVDEFSETFAGYPIV